MMAAAAHSQRPSGPPGQITPREARDTQSPKLRLNGICPYYAMFPLSFPFHHLRHARPGDWVLDPFCGRGTTTMAARLWGLPTIGVDSSPVAVAIASAKLCDVSSSQVITALRGILDHGEKASHIPDGEFWAMCYHRETLEEICQVREALLHRCKSSNERILRALMLGLLHGPVRKGAPAYLSNQMPRTYATKPGSAIRYWERHGLRPSRVPLLELVERRAAFTLAHRFPRSPGRILKRDSRQALPLEYQGRFDRVVTSPPYLGMNQYLRDQWLRNWFLGGHDRPTSESAPQVKSEDVGTFIKDLARAWTSTGRACKQGARMTVRFGSIPSNNVDPRTVLRESFDEADCHWRVLTVTDAGPSNRGKRQSGQFLPKPGEPISEVDFHVVLEEN